MHANTRRRGVLATKPLRTSGGASCLAAHRKRKWLRHFDTP
jgi:hypothetical protein